MKETTGYIILNLREDYLNRDHIWCPYDKPEDAFVHPEDSLEGILNACKSWDHKPDQLIPAVYRSETNISPNTINVSGLSLSETLDLVRKQGEQK